ncbi:hypothetical protein niasHT_017822 [Heterodera trifolii]|uniref:Uncharacterized protein n=1 Tax=Heterodera trifolii TaxID=157864 RepID=A0ABD2IJ56_9BILA
MASSDDQSLRDALELPTVPQNVSGAGQRTEHELRHQSTVLSALEVIPTWSTNSVRLSNLWTMARHHFCDWEPQKWRRKSSKDIATPVPRKCRTADCSFAKTAISQPKSSSSVLFVLCVRINRSTIHTVVTLDCLASERDRELPHIEEILNHAQRMVDDAREHIEEKVYSAIHKCEQLNEHFLRLRELKSEFEQHLKRWHSELVAEDASSSMVSSCTALLQPMAHQTHRFHGHFGGSSSSGMPIVGQSRSGSPTCSAFSTNEWTWLMLKLL